MAHSLCNTKYVKTVIEVDCDGLDLYQVWTKKHLRIPLLRRSDAERNRLIGLIHEEDDEFYTVTWQSNDEAGMWMTAPSFPPFSSQLSPISPSLSASIQTGSYITVHLLTGAQARPICVFVRWSPFTKEPPVHAEHETH